MRLWFEWCFLTNLAWHYQETVTGLPPKEGRTIEVVSNLRSATDFVSTDIHHSIFTAFWGAKTRGDYKYEKLKICWSVFLGLSGKNINLFPVNVCWEYLLAWHCIWGLPDHVLLHLWTSSALLCTTLAFPRDAQFEQGLFSVSAMYQTSGASSLVCMPPA